MIHARQRASARCRLSVISPFTLGGRRKDTPSIEGPLAGPGVSARGPDLFVTHASETDFDQATAITLHHDVGNAVGGPLTHYPVIQGRAEVDVDPVEAEGQLVGT